MAQAVEQVEAYWRGVLAAPSNSHAWLTGLRSLDAKAQREAHKALQKLPPSLPHALVIDVLALFAEQARAELWRAIAKLADAHIELLVRSVQNNDDTPARLSVTAHAAAGIAGLRHAAEFLIFVDKSSNVPAVLKRLPAFEASHELRTAAVRAVDQTKAPGSGDTLSFWALAWLAAQEDPAVLTRLEPRAAAWDSNGVLARVRAAVAAPAPIPQKNRSPPHLDRPRFQRCLRG